jgi:hypothetical protein
MKVKLLNESCKQVYQQCAVDDTVPAMKGSLALCRASTATATLAICIREDVPSCILAPPERHCTTTGS